MRLRFELETNGRGWFRRRGHASGGPSVVIAGGNDSSHSIELVPSFGRARYATLRAIYLTNPWVYSAVSMIARSLSRIPLHVYELEENGDKRRIRGDLPGRGRLSSGQELDRLLSFPTADRISPQARWEATLKDRLVYGAALWEKVKDGTRIVGLRHVPWADVAPRLTPARRDVDAYEIGGGVGGRRILLPEDVIHFGYGADPEEPAGVSPLLSCRSTLALHNAVMRHLLAYFGNSARPSGVIEVESLTRERYDMLREQIEQMLASPENAGRIFITSGTWKSVTDSPEHSQVVELMRESRLEVAATYQVPPPLLGILEDTNRATTKELREQYIRDSLGVWAGATEADIRAQLIAPRPQWAGMFAEFQLAEQIRPDLEARSQVYERSRNWLTPNEIRAKENMHPLDIPGADEPWVDSGAMPLSVAVKNAGSGAPPAAPAEQSRNGHRDDARLEEITT